MLPCSIFKLLLLFLTRLNISGYFYWVKLGIILDLRARVRGQIRGQRSKATSVYVCACVCTDKFRSSILELPSNNGVTMILAPPPP